MSKIWLWGDPHFSHKNILKHEPVRPFIDVEHMDNVIIENYNNTVDDGDIVFWLGDMFFCNSERTNYITKRLNLDGKRNILVRGNHDRRDSDTKFRRLGFMPTKMYMISGMMLTHHPMTPQNLAWLKHYNPAFIGNVHAHTHSADTGLSPALWQCVSMEKVDYKPIMWSDVRKRFLDVEKIMEWCENGGDNSNYFKTGDHIRR